MQAIQGATENKAVVIITGLTAMFSGAISMAAGSYLSSTAQKDIFDKELREAEILAEKEPYIAAEGLLKSLSQEGLTREQSYGIVKQLLHQEQAFLRTFQEKVFGIGSAEINQPLKAAIVMGLSFIIGALIPILPYFLLEGWVALIPLHCIFGADALRRGRLQRKTGGAITVWFGRAIFHHRR